MKNVILLTLAMLVSITSMSQKSNTGNIKGTIQTSDGKVAEGVSVSIKKINRITMTNNDGEFELKSIPEGTQTLVITLVGRTNLEQEIYG